MTECFVWFVQALSQGQDECDPVKKELKMGIIELASQEITTFSFKKTNNNCLITLTILSPSFYFVLPVREEVFFPALC